MIPSSLSLLRRVQAVKKYPLLRRYKDLWVVDDFIRGHLKARKAALQREELLAAKIALQREDLPAAKAKSSGARTRRGSRKP